MIRNELRERLIGTIGSFRRKKLVVGMLERRRAQDPTFFAVPESIRVSRVLHSRYAADKKTKSPKPAYLPHLRVAAQPVPELDHLLESTVDAAVVSAAGFE